MSIETCPLVEIVHFHKVLRKEMESVLLNTEVLVDILNKKTELFDTDIQFLKQTKNQFVLFFSVFKAHASVRTSKVLEIFYIYFITAIGRRRNHMAGFETKK